VKRSHANSRVLQVSVEEWPLKGRVRGAKGFRALAPVQLNQVRLLM